MHLYCASPSRWTSVRQRTRKLPVAVCRCWWCKYGGTGFRLPNIIFKKVITAWKSARKFSIVAGIKMVFLANLSPIFMPFDYRLDKSKNLYTREGMSLVFFAMHCKSASYILFLGNLLIFWFLKDNGGVKQSLKMSYQKSHKGIACVRVRGNLTAVQKVFCDKLTSVQ